MAQSSLLTSLIWIARHHGINVIAEKILAGLPVHSGELTQEYIERAAGNAGLTIFSRQLSRQLSLEENCPPSCLPCIVWLEKSPVVVVQIEKEFVEIIPIAFSKSLSCRQLCLGIITMHYLEQMSRRPQLPEGFNDVDF
ncbi:hypothetical protein, partial [Endozoicomonas atrinae]|uniref:hypothetical protein n=1 Tax=Endozoicomonas atrinae TaxID=1333660 RepID=UPI0019310B55